MILTEFLLNYILGNINGFFVQPAILQTKRMITFFNHLGTVIDVYHQTYDKFFLIGDFNAEDAEQCLSQFLFEHNPKKYCF